MEEEKLVRVVKQVGHGTRPQWASRGSSENAGALVTGGALKSVVETAGLGATSLWYSQ